MLKIKGIIKRKLKYRKIRYFDRIHNRYVELFVRDKISKEFQAYNKRIERQNKKDVKYIAFSLNEESEVNGEDGLKYEDIIADENSDISNNYDKEEFNNLIWSIVDKLPKEESIIIKAFFKYGYKPKEIAQKLKLTKEQFSQHKITAINHLRILMLSDKSFTKTDYFINSIFRPYPLDLDEIIEQIKSNTYEFDIDEIRELVRQYPQAVKQLKALRVELDEKEVAFGLLSNKEVRNTLNQVGDILSGKQNLKDVVYELVANGLDNYDKDKNNRELNELRKISPTLFGLEKHKEELVEIFKPCAKQYIEDKKQKDNEEILVLN